jgi:hypothetical protein
MKVFTIKGKTIRVLPCGYGQYKVTDGTVTLHDTHSQAYDACDDSDDFDYEYAQSYYYDLFVNYYRTFDNGTDVVFTGLDDIEQIRRIFFNKRNILA